MTLSKNSYLDLFRFRGDAMAIQQSDGSYIRAMRPPTENDLEKHLNHTKTLAFYPSMNHLCFLGCLDFDLPKHLRDNQEAHDELRIKIKATWDMMTDIGIESKLLENTGGRGYHIWVFAELTPTSMMFELLKQIVDSTLADAEIFPIDGFGLGKAIRPPLGKHRVWQSVSTFIDPETFEEIILDDIGARIISEKRMTKEFMESLGVHEVTGQTQRLDNDFMYDAIPKASDFSEVLEEMRPCFQKVYDSAIDTSGGDGWMFMTAAAAEVYANGGSDEHVHDFFRVQAQYHKKETAKHLKPIKRKSLLPFRCTRLQDTCGDYVAEYCPDCHIYKQHTLSEKIDEVVDKTQGKESRNDGDENIDDTLEQFDIVSNDLRDAMSGGNYTLMTNSFNGGKSWTMIAFLKHIIHTEGHRVNFIAPSNKIKEVMMSRMRKAEVNFMDNPSNMELCPRAQSFKHLGYIPTMVCKKCSAYTPIQKLVKPVTDDFIDSADKPFYADVAYFKEKADEYSTCAKWVYLATLEATKEENMVLIMTHMKLQHHFFIPDSPLIPAMTSDQTFCNIVDQIDFINRSIPKLTFSEKEVYRKMKLLGMVTVEDLADAMIRIDEMLEMDNDIPSQSLVEMEAVDYLGKWLHSQKMFEEGLLRRVSNKLTPEVYNYDLMGEKEINFILNDVMGKRINPKLYDNTLKYIQNIAIDTFDDIPRAPMSFKEILEQFTQCSAILGITSTPTELESMNSHWLSKYHDCHTNVLNNLYSIPNIKGVLDDIPLDEQTIIFSRKTPDVDYINDGLVRGNTGTGEDVDEVVIKAMQYPRNSEHVITDLIQLCGGNFGKGVKIFYEGIVSDAVTQAHKYNAEKIIVPNPDIFSALGFSMTMHEDMTMKYWEDKFRKQFIDSDYFYKAQLRNIPDDVLEYFVENGIMIMDGVKIRFNKKEEQI